MNVMTKVMSYNYDDDRTTDYYEKYDNEDVDNEDVYFEMDWEDYNGKCLG